MNLIGTLSFVGVQRRKSVLHHSSFNLYWRHGLCLSVNWRSRFARVQSVNCPEAISKCLSLRSRVGNRLAAAILQGRDLSAEPGVSLQVTKELLRVGGSLLRHCGLKANACFPLHVDTLVTLSVVDS